MKNLSIGLLSKKNHVFYLSLFISLLLIIGGYFFYDYMSSNLKKEKEKDLTAIGQLKINQLSRWYKERITDINVLSKSTFFINAFENWLLNEDDINLKDEIRTFLSTIVKEYGYESIFLINNKGQLQLSVGSDLSKFDTTTLTKIYESLKKQKTIISDFYYCNMENKIHYDIIVPIISNKKEIAILVFRIDPNDYLYPFIQLWPTPSKTAETLLIRKEGNAVLFLNELRHQKNTALKLKIPLTEKEVAAVEAVLGFKGIWEGKDYRDENVISYLDNVPGTNWYVVAKIDTDEVLSELKFISYAIALFVFILIFSLSVGLAWIYHYRQRNIYRELYKTQEEFKTVLHSIGDAVITTDKNGNVKYLNPVAEELTGWNIKDALDKKLNIVFNIINEETRADVANPVEKVLTEGVVVGLAKHTILISKDGKETPIADSGAPIKDNKGNIIGVVLVFRDQTIERENRKKLTDSEKKYRRLFEATQDGILILEFETGKIVDVNPFLIKLLGYPHKALTGKTLWEIGLFKDIIANNDNFIELQQKEYIRYDNLPLVTANGNKINVEFVSNVYLVDNHKVIQCNIRDITERKIAEQKLHFLTSRQTAILESVPDIIMEVDSNKIYTWANKAGYDFFGDDVIGKSADYYFEGDQDIYAQVQPLFNGYENIIYVESWQRRKDGKICLLAWWCRVLKDSNGNVTGALSTARDITEQYKAEKEIRHLNRLYAMLSQTNQAIVHLKNRDELFDEVCSDAIRYGEFKLAWIGLFNSVKNRIEPYIWKGEDSGFIENDLANAPQDMRNLMPCTRAFKENRIVVNNDVATDPDCDYWREAALKRNFKSLAAAPIYLKNNAIGVFVLYSSEPNFFGEKEINLLNEVSIDISFALDTYEKENLRRILEKERNLLFNTIEKSVNEIYIFDAETLKFRYANNGALNNIGYTLDELQTITPVDIKPHIEYNQFLEFIAPLLNKEKEIINFETVHRRKDGTDYPVEVRLQLFEFENEKVFLAVIQDITVRKQTEELLLASEERFRGLYENSTIGLYRTTPDGKIILANPALVTMLGFDSSDELRTRNLEKDGYEPDYSRDKFIELINKNGIIYGLESKWKKKDGTFIYVHESAKAIKDENGNILYYDGTVEDITDKKKAIEALVESEKKFRSVVEEAVEIVFTIDINGYFTYVNPAGIKASGFSFDELLKLKYSDLVEPTYRKRVTFNYLKQFVKRIESTSTEYPFKTKAGEVKWFNQNARLIIENDEVKGFYVIARDVTERRKIEDALKESEERFRNLFETTYEGILAADENEDITLANPRIADMLGYTIDELLHMNFSELIIPEEKDENSIKILDRKMGKTDIYERKLVRKDKSIIWTLVSATPMIDKNGKFIGSYGMFTDITDRKKAEETIQADRILLRAIIDNLPDAIYAKDINFRKTLSNKADLENMGALREEEVIGKTDYDFFPKENADKFIEDDKKIINTGRAIFNKEESFVDKSGNRRWLLTSKLPLRNEKGNIVGLLGIGRDITERKKSELKLIENENRFRSISKTANDAIIVANAKGLIVYWNQSAVRIFGYNINEILTKPLDVIIPKRYREAHHLGMERFAKTKIPNTIGKTVEMVGLRKDSSEFPIELSLASWETSEGLFYSAIIRDITDRKKQHEELIKAKEKAEKADQLKTEFLAQMSHEIRTPINVILSFNNLLKDEVEGKIDPDLYKMFDSVEFSSSRIIRTIDMILNMSELHTGTYEPFYKIIDIQNDVIDRLINEYQNKAKSKGLRFLYQYKAKDMKLKADEYSVIQIFANLIDNAIKYTDKGKVEVTVSRNKDNKLEVAVADTGIGISEEYLTRIFEPFSQEEHGYSRLYEGNGLGLALVKRYCDINNAYITIETKKGAGSKFTVVFNEV